MPMKTTKMPVYFISHGGGPWPWMPEMASQFAVLEKFLKELPSELPSKPRAVLMVSGHWEEPEFTVMTSSKPPLIYDYGGFPEHTYHLKYPAPGAPEIARKAEALLSAQGFRVEEDKERGLDHGVFVPLYVMYPEAEVPVFQISLKKGLDPETHLRMGRALAPLREEQVLIVGSGLSFHNLRLMWDLERGGPPSRQFDAWLQEVMAKDPEQRRCDLLNWQSAPAARIAHPREEHLLPLMVALGAAENEIASLCHHESFLGAIAVSSFKFGS